MRLPPPPPLAVRAHRSPQTVGVDVEAGCDPHHVLVTHKIARVLGNDCSRDLRRAGSTFDGGLVGDRERPVDAELHEWLRRLDRLREQLRVVAPHVGGITPERKVGYFELDVVALLPPVPALSCTLACCVGVIREHHLARRGS